LTGKVEYATLEHVRARLAWLKEQKIEKEKNQGQEMDLSRRIANRRRIEEEEKQRRRDKKKAKRLLKRRLQNGSDVD
jgi:U4/U6.U5 tri-snRNP component SNU23